MKRLWWVVLLIGISLTAGAVAAGDSRSIVAVFDVEAKGVDLNEALLDRLSDYIANRLTGSGQYQVVPRDQIRERLATQKNESYKACYDQSCQIELGKEMAADRSLSTSIMKLGSRCTVTMSLFDLRMAAAEKAASEHGKCSEDEIVATIDKTIDKLLSGLEAREPSPKPTTVARPMDRQPVLPAKGLASIEIVTTPPGANVFIDNRTKGKTPMMVELEIGKAYDLELDLDGYYPKKGEIEITGRKRFTYEMRITAEKAQDLENEKKNMTEWVSLYVQTGGDKREFYLFGFGIQLLTYKWDWFSLSVLDGGIGGMMIDGSLYGYFGPSFGIPIRFDSAGKSELTLCSGIGFAGGFENAKVIDEYDEESDIGGFGFALFPSIRYAHRVSESIFLTFRFTLSIPLVTFVDTSTFKVGELMVLLGSIGFAWAS